VSNGRSRVATPESSADAARELAELAADLRRQRAPLLDEWVRRIIEAHFLTTVSRDQLGPAVSPLYDGYIEALETGTTEPLEASARSLLQRGRLRSETHEVVGLILLLRDVLAQSLRESSAAPSRGADILERAASRLAVAVAVGLVEERERAIRDEQEAIRELSTPLLQIRDRLFILPMIGVIDQRRARQLTEQVLRGVRSSRAKVVLIDMTGVPTLDASAATHLVQTVDAARLLGTIVIMSGISAELAHMLVSLGVDLGRVLTVGDLQAGLEEAEKLLGYRLITRRAAARPG
jgi:rsbT co-antagonist protein RsbR